jgi:cold shock CspA family protein
MERGTIVSWSLSRGQWYDVIRADNGDRVLPFYWSVVQGFKELRVGQRVEFSRMIGVNGLERNVASLAVPRFQCTSIDRPKVDGVPSITPV